MQRWQQVVARFRNTMSLLSDLITLPVGSFLQIHYPELHTALSYLTEPSHIEDLMQKEKFTKFSSLAISRTNFVYICSITPDKFT